MWMWRLAQITPSWSSTLPAGPSSTMAAEPATLPESRIGASIPSLNSSVREIST